MSIDYFDEEDQPVEGASLDRLRELADDATILEGEILEKQKELTKLQEKYVKLTRVTIPEVMAELQLRSFKLEDGSELKVEPKVQASIKPENKEKAFAWLSKYGFDGLIKTKVQAEYGKGEMEAARKAQQAIIELGGSASLEQLVHPATLTSFVKERLAAAADGEPEQAQPEVQSDGFDDEETAAPIVVPNLPLDIFSVYEYKQAKLVIPKKRKK